MALYNILLKESYTDFCGYSEVPINVFSYCPYVVSCTVHYMHGAQMNGLLFVLLQRWDLLGICL